MSKEVLHVVGNIQQHWVGDGFPVRHLLTYSGGNRFDPFLLLDYAGPHEFAATKGRRGVEVHPHKGFETVTILYQGELSHRDSSGGNGHLRPGDVQWMTAGSGIVHEEFHSETFSQRGGTLEMIQLSVNLPAKDKAAPPKYQDLRAVQFPCVPLKGNAGQARVIAGQFDGVLGPATTFTPINVWDIEVEGGRSTGIAVPEGHTCVLVLQEGAVSIGQLTLEPVNMAQFGVGGDLIELQARADSRMLLLTGEPLNEPVAGQGPFVMNTAEELREAIREYQAGKMGTRVVQYRVTVFPMGTEHVSSC